MASNCISRIPVATIPDGMQLALERTIRPRSHISNKNTKLRGWRWKRPNNWPWRFKFYSINSLILSTLGPFQNVGCKAVGGQIGSGGAEIGGWKIDNALFDRWWSSTVDYGKWARAGTGRTEMRKWREEWRNTHINLLFSNLLLF